MAAPSMRRGFSCRAGSSFLAGPLSSVACLFVRGSLPERTTFIRSANWAMGVFFGGAHAAYGLYLYFTEKRGNAT